MRINGAIKVPDEAIAGFCRKWRITELSLFSSVLREDFGPNSDIDVLARFEPDSPWDLWDVPTMQEELGALLGREVDLVDKDTVERSSNPFRKQSILRNSRVVYTRG